MSIFANKTPAGLLGDILLVKDADGKAFKECSSREVLADCDAVGLYYSASWCRPCTMFTPELADRYKQLKAAGKKVEIVLISGDDEEDAFKKYYEENMPFLALPFSERDRKEALEAVYEVEGIPTLVFIDGKTGKLLTVDGTDKISQDSFIQAFPYADFSFADETPAGLLGDILLVKDADGKAFKECSSREVLADCDAVGLYY
jgi:nucleoredoxin